jgi:ComF family protein
MVEQAGWRGALHGRRYERPSPARQTVILRRNGERIDGAAQSGRAAPRQRERTLTARPPLDIAGAAPPQWVMSLAVAPPGLGPLRHVGGRLLDLVLPPLCLGCARPVSDHGALCAACWAEFHPIARPYCERLGTPFALDLGPGALSPKAIADPPAFGRARAVARFDGTARRLVHRLKYSDRLDLAPAMGRWMRRAGAEVLEGADLLVPVPLHPFRLWRRRFNQAAELARAIAGAGGPPVIYDALRRTRPTRPQVGLSASERARNLQGAFAVRAEDRPRLAGRRLVLVDDVMTTGSTLDVAARVLRRAGAAEVDALVFAVVADNP